MKKLANLSDLLSEQLKELLSAEKHQQEALPKLAKAAHSDGLNVLIRKNLDDTGAQIRRLEDALIALGQTKKPAECNAMKELLDRTFHLMKKSENADVLEAGLISSLQCIRHFEIAGYGTLASFAGLLENNHVQELLKKTIAEEKEMDKNLTELAEKTINLRAKRPSPVTA